MILRNMMGQKDALVHKKFHQGCVQENCSASFAEL